MAQESIPAASRPRSSPGRSLEAAVERFARAASGLERSVTVRDALQAIAEACAGAMGAELAVIRVLDDGGELLETAAVATRSAARAAEIEGTRIAVRTVSAGQVDRVESLPPAARALAERIGASAALQLPVTLGEGVVATLELLRTAGPFTRQEAALARLAAAQIALCLRVFAAAPGAAPPSELYDIAGEALAAGASEEPDPDRLARLAADAWDAGAVVVWVWPEDGGALEPVGTFGLSRVSGRARALAESALASSESPALERDTAALPDGFELSTVVALGRPPLGALQLLFHPGQAPADDRLTRLATFGVNAARALRAAERSAKRLAELDHSRALLGVLGQAIAELSLAHTLATALDRVGAFLGVERLAVYLREGDTLLAAAGYGLVGPHPLVAARLLDLALGGGGPRGLLVIEDAAADGRLAEVAGVLAETGIEAALAVPLVANEEVIGVLAAYPARGTHVEEGSLALLEALAGRLAVAVQNARLHEQAKELSAEREAALSAEREAGRRLRALYEVSRSFAQSLSVEATLDAVTRAAVESLGLDAAVLRVPDARGEALVTQALRVADPRLEQVLQVMLTRAQVLSKPALQRLFRRGQPISLDAERARSLGGSFDLLTPFLEKGSTAIVVPVASPTEILATLTLISLDPGRPIEAATVDAALSLAGQAALAVENARLYQQQKQFTDAMQRALLPRRPPKVPGLEVGVVYESSARMDVGGDVYDFMTLEDGRLAVVLGDVTGHGIDAAADMAMAKFVFRSVAREHPEPADFLAHANDVVAGEIAAGKFITLLYLLFDPATSEMACAAGGHPSPRLVEPDGAVGELTVLGLALGIEPGHRYQEVRRTLVAGSSVVLYTDGVVEARRDGALYGVERLDALVAREHDLPPQRLAESIVADCRKFGRGELPDDCAVVVLRRL